MAYHRLSGPSYVARSTDGGATWDGRRTQVSPGSAALPRLARRESDGLYIVTYQTNPGGNDLDLWARLSTDPYDWSAPPVAVSTEVNTHDSQAIVLEDGTLVVFFARQVGSAFDVFFRRSRDGRAWSAATRVTEYPDRYDTQPHPVLGGAPGRVILLWPHQDGGTPYVDHDVWVDTDVRVVPLPTLFLPLVWPGSG
jgi:hypothetical protein